MAIINSSLNLALFQPEIPQNTGAAMRLCACLGLTLDIIEPCGFLWDEKKIRQSAMDYINHVTYKRHNNWQEFQDHYKNRRLILMTTKSTQSYVDFTFQEGDILIAGQESAGAPPYVHEACGDNRITIPMHGKVRSMNVINACSMVLGEGLRQLRI
jgi:tRNA (cytidine/uridine-2'-O-)-methyltransferase